MRVQRIGTSYRTRDPKREKARLRFEIRLMREAFKHGLYEDDGHTFWREVEGHQAQLDSAHSSNEFKLAMADSIILATARACDANLWTQDEHCKCIEGARYKEKKPKNKS